MAKKNLRDPILENAKALFRVQGYAGTSVKQIAEATGCTAPALYYFFEGGKAEILKEVVRSYEIDPDITLSEIKSADSLEEMLEKLGQQLPPVLRLITHDLKWLNVEIPDFPEEELGFIQDYPLAYFQFIDQEISRFITDSTESRNLAWTVFCAYCGYSEIFSRMGVSEHEGFTNQILGNTLLRLAEADLINE